MRILFCVSISFSLLACDALGSNASSHKTQEASASISTRDSGHQDSGQQGSAKKAAKERGAPGEHHSQGSKGKAQKESLFLRVSDRETRERLLQGRMVEVEKGRGGRSLGFKITLDNGQKGYFKPEQSFSGAHWYGEVGAHYLDRELGFGRALPVVGRRFAWKPLRRAAKGDKRISEVTVEKAQNGQERTVRGAFIAWVDEGVERLRLAPGWEKRLREEGGLHTSPYQRPAILRDIAGGRRANEPAGSRHKDAIQAHTLTKEQLGALSDLIVFDYLISNFDRWGGDGTNVRTHGTGGPLLFFDNGASFWPNPRPHLQERRLNALQKFRPETVEALRSFEPQSLRSRLANDALSPVLSEKHLEGIETRVKSVLDYVSSLEKKGIDFRL